jgi:hypothetical protein
VAARRAKRQNWGLGEDTPTSNVTVTYFPGGSGGLASLGLCITIIPGAGTNYIFSGVGEV